MILRTSVPVFPLSPPCLLSSHVVTREHSRINLGQPAAALRGRLALRGACSVAARLTSAGPSSRRGIRGTTLLSLLGTERKRGTESCLKPALFLTTMPNLEGRNMPSLTAEATRSVNFQNPLLRVFTATYRRRGSKRAGVGRGEGGGQRKAGEEPGPPEKLTLCSFKSH